ncbi:hypothetical protein V1477_002458 [Vespula maculifrons]|uniref:Uncharacterized protein n=1 Tax=Vespula maculifrons TaxID=7453 RepID=A0ABD2CWJ1_VESMC
MSTTATGALSVAKVCSDLTRTDTGRNPSLSLIRNFSDFDREGRCSSSAFREKPSANSHGYLRFVHWKLVRLRRLAKPLGPDFTGFRRLINFGVAFRAPFVPTVQNSASLRGKYRFSREYLGMSSSELGRL